MLVGEFVAVLAMETFPESVATAGGAKLTEKEVDCPGLSVSGSANPAREKPVPVTLSELSVTLAFPVLTRVAVNAKLLPVATSPNPSAVGTTESCRAAATPDPDSEAVKIGVAELLATFRVPENEVAEVGAKLTVNAALAPGAMVRVVLIQVVYVCMVYGPIAAFLVELFPARVRYTSLSLPTT
jgi:hypothetical protein